MYGCIGEHLPHSFSREIHELIGDYAYELKEITPDGLDEFMRNRDFRAINVTIPYKQAVMPHLAYISETARSIGAVNTIVNREGTLHGYNTDFDGMTRLIHRMGLDFSGCKVLILGTGGTSKTALHVARALGAASVFRVSRTAREDALTYEQAMEKHADADFIINTTPCGMFPHAEEQPVFLQGFTRLKGLVDAIYNPLRSNLVLEARAMGVPAEGGLYMLVAQAVRAAEIFRDTQYPEELTDGIYARILREKENIVLIGMPASGKSTVSRQVAQDLKRDVVDTDTLIVQKAGMLIPEIFARYGEARFREIESEVIRELSGKNGLVIATGGGAVLRQENVTRLKRNGRLFLLDRSLSELLPTADRPLANSREKIERLYRERMPVYRAAADEIVPVARTPRETAKDIESR